jgi:geranylgeranyl pyrophosphate synthase
MAIGAIRRSGAIDRAARVADEFIERARETISVVPDEETRELLTELTDLAVHRAS